MKAVFMAVNFSLGSPSPVLILQLLLNTISDMYEFTGLLIYVSTLKLTDSYPTDYFYAQIEKYCK